MRVDLLYFGVLKDIVGRDSEQRELALGTSVAQLLYALEQQAGSAAWKAVAVAVNREYVQTSAILRHGDEVAFLPPVSGGSCER